MKVRILPATLLILLVATCSDENLFHELTVVNGSGSGTYRTGEQVSIEANPAPGGFEVFDAWTGDTELIQNPDTPSTTIEMPLQDVLVEATYTTLPKFTLMVILGSGSGQYFAGEEVRITADPPPTGEEIFANWTGDIQHLAEPRAPSQTLIMPKQDVQIEAVYISLPKYALQVKNGTGSGEYLEGARVEIMAIPPEENLSFLEWSGDVTHLDDPAMESTFVTMPDSDIVVEGTFEQKSTEVSFRTQIQPIVITRCVDGGCHDLFHPKLILTEYRDIKDNLEPILFEIGPQGTMQYFSEPEKALFLEWVDQGAKNN